MTLQIINQTIIFFCMRSSSIATLVACYFFTWDHLQLAQWSLVDLHNILKWQNGNYDSRTIWGPLNELVIPEMQSPQQNQVIFHKGGAPLLVALTVVDQ